MEASLVQLPHSRELRRLLRGFLARPRDVLVNQIVERAGVDHVVPVD